MEDTYTGSGEKVVWQEDLRFIIGDSCERGAGAGRAPLKVQTLFSRTEKSEDASSKEG